MRPLLHDQRRGVRRTAAYVLARALKNRAGPDVIAVAIEMLNSGDDTNLIPRGLLILTLAGGDPGSPRSLVTSASLADAVKDAIAALTAVANDSRREDLRTQALQMLEILDPSLRPANPKMDDALKNHEQTAAFTLQVRSGKASLADLIAGLKKFPSAIPEIARALGQLGTKAQSALPALRAALAARGPAPDKSTPPDRFRAYYDAGEAIADAIQQIDPDQPKPLFAENDMRSVMDLLHDPSVRSDSGRSQRISAALRPVLADAPGHGIELTPDQMRRVLELLKGTDEPVYETLAALVLKIDPHFE